MKSVKDLITIDEIEAWKEESIILINAGTGKGKTTFIKETLFEYCKYRNKKILLLVNRTALRKQVNSDLAKKKEKDTVIRVASYQAVIKLLRAGKNIKHFDYVVADEVHFFFSDALFNNTTDLAWNWLINNKGIKILMSATPTLPKEYIRKVTKKKPKEYKIKTNYNEFIDKLYFYKNDKIIDKILFDLPPDEKAIYFGGAKKAHRLCTILKDAKFYCSKNNPDGLHKYADIGTFDDIVTNEKFDCQVLCCTSALDNGINFCDPKLKHIIIDYLDLDELQQMIGRKRLLSEKNCKLSIYIKDWNKQNLNRIFNFKNLEMEPADYLKSHGDIALTLKFQKKCFTWKNAIDTIVDSNNEIHHVINEMMYTKQKNSIEAIKNMMDVKNGYRKAVISRLQFKMKNVVVLDESIDEYTLIDYLDSFVGKKLFKEEQQQLKNFLINNDNLFNPAKTDHDCLGYNQINGYFEDHNLLYCIKGKNIENSRKSENYKKSYWLIYKLCDQIVNM